MSGSRAAQRIKLVVVKVDAVIQVAGEGAFQYGKQRTAIGLRLGCLLGPLVALTGNSHHFSFGVRPIS